MAAVGHVVVTGLMGAGKTTIGRRLAERLDRTWRDSDADIEARTGMTVRALRDRHGVEAMHALETAHLLEALAAADGCVVSAAASVIDDPAARMAMTVPGVTVVWLQAPPHVLAERFGSEPHRPAYGDAPETFLAEQAARREPLLGAIGARRIDTVGLTPDEVVERVMELLG